MNNRYIYGVWRDKPARYDMQAEKSASPHGPTAVEYFADGVWYRMGGGYDTEFRVFCEEAKGREDLMRSLELKTVALKP